ncbi:MAG: tetratricopeptide repeat protein [Gemmatimonadota bacterium]
MTRRSSFVLLALVTMIIVPIGSIACARQQTRAPDLPREVRRLLDRGQWDEAERLVAAGATDPARATLLGEVLVARGRLVQADSAFARAIRVKASDWATAQAGLAELRLRRGDAKDALRLAEELAQSLEATQTANDAAAWTALGRAYEVLGTEHPIQFKDALVAYDRAIAKDSTWIEADLRLGAMFLEKYNGPDARSAFNEALRRDPESAQARLGGAQVAVFDGDSKSMTLARRSLETNPRFAAAHALIGRLELDAEQYDSAGAAARRALEGDSTSLEAVGILGAIAALRADSAALEAAAGRARSLRAAPADFYTDIAEAMARHRRYREAADWARQAVTLDPGSPRALGTLGMNQLRLGLIDSARTNLDAAFSRDPYHIWNKNTLDLLEAVKGYAVTRSNRFVFVADPEESELLTLYLAPLLERAYDSLAVRYNYKPPTPVRLEIYRRHADFSVRTVGLAGIGALGVSFGSVLAMDSPSAREGGDFNWLSTAWHELTHAFTLGVTEHRVPRWFSEGLSVLEERRARRGWGAQATLGFLVAYKAGRLKRLTDLNDGFVQPEYPAQVMFSYYQASLVCEYIEQTFGFAGIQRMLEHYRRGETTPVVVQEALGVPLVELDRRFDGWFRARFAKPIAAVSANDSLGRASHLRALVATGRQLLEGGRSADAEKVLHDAADLWPENGDPDSPWGILGKLYVQRGDTAKAIDAFARLTAVGETNLGANRAEASLRMKTGDLSGAEAALDRLVALDPRDVAVHDTLAQVAAKRGDYAVAIRERKALLALKPSDRAGALYQLALAYAGAGQRADARREVLRALEEAPAFEKAQSLLLDLQEKGARP